MICVLVATMYCEASLHQLQYILVTLNDYMLCLGAVMMTPLYTFLSSLQFSHAVGSSIIQWLSYFLNPIGDSWPRWLVY